jgi:hypothetical protein
MKCQKCDADVSTVMRSDEILPRCRGCGSVLLPAGTEAELEGFRARLAQLGLGEQRLTMPNDRCA